MIHQSHGCVIVVLPLIMLAGERLGEDQRVFDLTAAMDDKKVYVCEGDKPVQHS